jgi:hypothetical protein
MWGSTVYHPFHHRDPLCIYIFAVLVLADVANRHLPLVAANLLLFVVKLRYARCIGCDFGLFNLISAVLFLSRFAEPLKGAINHGLSGLDAGPV